MLFILRPLLRYKLLGVFFKKPFHHFLFVYYQNSRSLEPSLPISRPCC